MSGNLTKTIAKYNNKYNNNATLYANYIYSPTKVKHHLTYFNNIFSNNELISIGLLFLLPVHTYLVPVQQVIDRCLFMCI